MYYGQIGIFTLGFFTSIIIPNNLVLFVGFMKSVFTRDFLFFFPFRRRYPRAYLFILYHVDVLFSPQILEKIPFQPYSEAQKRVYFS